MNKHALDNTVNGNSLKTSVVLTRYYEIKMRKTEIEIDQQRGETAR